MKSKMKGKQQERQVVNTGQYTEVWRVEVDSIGSRDHERVKKQKRH